MRESRLEHHSTDGRLECFMPSLMYCVMRPFVGQAGFRMPSKVNDRSTNLIGIVRLDYHVRKLPNIATKELEVLVTKLFGFRFVRLSAA